MKKDVKLLLFGSLIIVFVSILKLYDVNRFVVNILYTIGFFIEILGLIYLIKRFKK